MKSSYWDRMGRVTSGSGWAARDYHWTKKGRTRGAPFSRWRMSRSGLPRLADVHLDAPVARAAGLARVVGDRLALPAPGHVDAARRDAAGREVVAHALRALQ